MRAEVIQISDWLPSIIIAGSLIALGVLFQKIASSYFHRLAHKGRKKESLVFVTSLRGMIILVFAVVGIYEGIVHAPYTLTELPNIKKLKTVVIILIITFVAARIFKGLFKVYAQKETGKGRSLSLFSTIISIVVYCLGGLVIMDSLGISITPILTALGVGGLAVALALQDTLSNLFAGIHITLSHIVKPGNYIALNSGEEGTVSDITWRYTTMVNQSGNLVVIPNSKLSSAIVTNYSLPNPTLDFSIPFTLNFTAEFDKVEKIVLDEAEAVRVETGMLQDNFAFRVKEFSEDGVKCLLNLTVHDYNGEFIVRHLLVKRLLVRFKKDGITIPYGTRDIRTVPVS